MKKSIEIESYKGAYSAHIIDSEDKAFFHSVLRDISKDSFLVIDSKINSLYPDIGSMWDSDNVFFVKAKEKNKSFKTCNKLISFLIERKITKNGKIVAIGGGIVQDIAAFSASVIYRGIDWIFVPTTLLSQADSCIGSKTSINFNKAKNLIGSFHPPREIYSFSFFLETLSEDDIKSGIGEILHYYLIYNSKKTKEISSSYEEILKDRKLLQSHILESLSIKKRMIEVDEFDKKERNIFNYGHTFGHAIEVLSNYKISHGRAVTLGMDIANFISYKKSLITLERYKELKKMIEKNIPKFTIKPNMIDKYIKILQKDKKNTKGAVRCILMGENKVSIYSIEDMQYLSLWINEYFQKESL